MTAMRVEFPYLMSDRDRHGNMRLYARKNGRKIRIKEPRGSAAFARAYSEALEALDAPKPEGRRIAKAGTLGWLAGLYFGSGEFKGIDAKSQTARRLIIEECLREPRKPGSSDLMRDCPLMAFSAKHVKVLRDRKAGKPGAANNRRKHLSAMFGWAVEAEHVKANPVRDARKIKYSSGGFHTWSVEEVRQYEEFYPIGSKARLALALLLFLGVRRGDMVKLGKQHIRDGKIGVVPHKTLHLRDEVSYKPILPMLADIIARSPCGDLTFLVTQYGQAFTAAGFGDRMRKWCNAAGLPHCSAHGLRKAGATIAADLGATDRQLMALYDWSTASQANTYTRAADKKRLAEEAAKLIANGNCPTTLPHQKTG